MARGPKKRPQQESTGAQGSPERKHFRLAAPDRPDKWKGLSRISGETEALHRDQEDPWEGVAVRGEYSLKARGDRCGVHPACNDPRLDAPAEIARGMK